MSISFYILLLWMGSLPVAMGDMDTCPDNGSATDVIMAENGGSGSRNLTSCLEFRQAAGNYTISLSFTVLVRRGVIMVCEKCSPNVRMNLNQDDFPMGFNGSRGCDIILQTNGMGIYTVYYVFIPEERSIEPTESSSNAATIPTTDTTVEQSNQGTSIPTTATTVKQTSQEASILTEAIQQGNQGDKLSASKNLSALWIALVAIFIVLVGALVAFIVLRNRRNASSVDKVDPQAQVGTSVGAHPNHLRGKGVVPNPVYGSSGSIANGTEGDVYSTAYQRADDLSSNKGVDAEKLAHEYAYADLNGPSSSGDSDLDKGQVYNVAYQSVDDSYNKSYTEPEGSHDAQRDDACVENGPQNDLTYQCVDDEYSTTPEPKQIDDHDYVTLEPDRPGSVSEPID